MEQELNVINKYCGQIEERIKACKNRDIAEILLNRLCSELDQNCKSDVVLNFLRVHVEKLIKEVFDENGNNRLMEKKE
jgi:hypothetical protein